VSPAGGLGLAPLGFLELDPPALIEVAAAAGFAWVTARTRAAVAGGAEYPLDPGSPRGRETAARIDATGVRILQVELVSLGRETDTRAYRGLLEGGAALGATRVVASGDDPDDLVVIERLAALCELAAELDMVVDLEFMPFRAVATLPQALDIVGATGSDNACVMVDALHLFRSGGSVADVAAAPPARLGICQLCDAPSRAPASAHLATEAREGRLLPGQGELPLQELVATLPPEVSYAVEVPLAAPHGELPAPERAALLYGAAAPLLA
jgi:sugar phosphate isomerase/epimerase